MRVLSRRQPGRSFRLRFGLLVLCLAANGSTGYSQDLETATVADPLASGRWSDMWQAVLAQGRYEFDDRVQVQAPATAEDPLQVPVTIDARALLAALPEGMQIREVRVFADFNPILEVLRFDPYGAQPYLGFRVKLQQTTPVRAAARTSDGVWHVGGTWVITVGGGCTAPSFASASTEWQKRLNEVTGRQWQQDVSGRRLRWRVIHPMDTGLVAGTPAFHLEDLDVRDASGALMMHLQLHEPVSENPVFTVQYSGAAQTLSLNGHDNNGNALQARISP